LTFLKFHHLLENELDDEELFTSRRKPYQID